MKYNIHIFIIIVLLGIPISLSAQTAMQQIVRFHCPWGNRFVPNVQSGGDINGDGIPDLVLACSNDTSTASYDRKLFIYHSIPDSLAQPDQLLESTQQNWGLFGDSFTYAGDLNGDGVNDLVVGSYYYGEIQSGAVSIYFGGSVLSNEPDVVLYGSNYVDDSWGLNFGYRVVSGCDVNGDGFDDLLVYGKGIESVFSGNVFVFLGGSEFSTSCALHLVGTEVREELGNKLTAGDINGDGYDDIILTRTTNYNSTNVECFLDIYAGGPTLNNVPVFETVVQTYQHGAASKYLADGDINGDGYEDILGIYYADSASTIGIIYGASTFSTLSTTVFPFLNYYDGSPMSYCDFDGDQFSDLFFERYRLSPTGPGNGYFTVFEQNNPVLNLDCDYIFSGDQDMTNYGKGYFLGDMNQDGFPEFFVYSDDLSPNEIVNYGTILSQNYVSINDPVITNLKSGILCYPNPFSHYFKIQLSGKQTNTIHEVRIYNIRGRLVYSGKNIKSSSFTLNFYNSSLANISNGIYIVKVFGNNDSIYTSKILYLKGDNR